MKWLNAIERKIGRHYIPNLMKYLVLAMAGVFILEYLPLPRSAYQFLMFDRAAVLRGEIWRVITFISCPPMPAFSGLSSAFISTIFWAPAWKASGAAPDSISIIYLGSSAM